MKTATLEKPVHSKSTILDNMEYHDILRENIENLKRQKQELDQSVLLSNIQLRNNQDTLAKAKQEFESWKYKESKKIEEEKTKSSNLLIQQRESFQREEENFTRRLRELSEREISIKKVEDERKELREKMLEVEKLSSKAKIELQNVCRADIGDLNVREDKLKAYEKDLDAKLKNVEEVRSFIEPKLNEIKLIEDNTKKLLEEIKVKECDISSKLEQNKNIIITLGEKSKKLDEREKLLKCEESRIKSLVKK